MWLCPLVDVHVSVESASSWKTFSTLILIANESRFWGSTLNLLNLYVQRLFFFKSRLRDSWLSKMLFFCKIYILDLIIWFFVDLALIIKVTLGHLDWRWNLSIAFNILIDLLLNFCLLIEWLAHVLVSGRLKTGRQEVYQSLVTIIIFLHSIQLSY